MQKLYALSLLRCYVCLYVNLCELKLYYVITCEIIFHCSSSSNKASSMQMELIIWIKV